MSSTPTYKGGIPAILAQYEGRRDTFDYAPGEGLPPLDMDLAALQDQIVGNPDDDPAEAGPMRSSYHRKRHTLRVEFQGQSELCFLNGLLISHLRKRDWPDHAPALFHRLWAEHADHLLARLNPRWLVSAVTTFGDAGLTPVQRSTGLALTALFGAMKLYESERLYSGLTPDAPFPLDQRAKDKLPLEMDSFALIGGGLDVNLLGRLWQEADADPVIAPLAHHLIDMLVHDNRTVFRRLMTMRAQKEKLTEKKRRSNPAPVPVDRLHLKADTLRWGLVSTIKAPLEQIARFAAHHIELGANALHIYLDEPNSETAAFLSRHPAIHVTQCDNAYWRATGKTRMQAHQLRQAFNATRTLRRTADDLDWLGHIDVDEFLIAGRPVPQILAGVPPANAVARIPPAEALAVESGVPNHFKLTHKEAGIKKSRLQDIYPTFGLHLYAGFLSHTSGKVFGRTGIPDTRLGIHTMKYRGEDSSNKYKVPDLFVAHFHAPNWEHFRAHLEFRHTKGSYRARSEKTEIGQGALFDVLLEDGDEGLRTFFDEVCADTPELREKLRAHDMLLTHEFDFDDAVRRVFGAMP